MKTANITRLLIGTLPGERKPNHALAHKQLTTAKKLTTKGQQAAELVAFKRNLTKMSKRQLEQLHTRLKARLGKLALQKLMREAQASK